MAHQPWSLGLYLATAALITMAVWLISRRNRTIPRRLLRILMTFTAASSSWFVWWIGQGSENWLANELYLVTVGVLFAVGVSLSVISLALSYLSPRTGKVSGTTHLKPSPEAGN